LGMEDHQLVAHAVNHWDLAVAAHGRNLPWVNVHQEDIYEVTAATYGLDRIHLLWASPSCVHHSRARGGKPREDQQRAHAWEVTDRWLKVAHVDVVLIENVPEFMEWGPLDDAGMPIKDRKGEFFRAWVQGLHDLGYEVDWRVLCAADFGAPTTRRRFFLQAVRDGKGIHWPEPTHRDPRKGADMFTGHLPTWRTAAECIDWSIPVPSIFGRKRPLAEATLRRIAAGVVRYVLQGKPFVLNLTHGGRLEPADEPLRTVTTAKRGEKAIVSASIVGVGGRAGQSAPRGLAEPMHTGTTKADSALVAASMVSLRGTSPEQIQATAGSIEAPVPTISAGGGHAGLVAAFLAKHYGGVVGQAADRPLGTVTAVDHHSLVAASLIQTGYGEREGQAPRCLDIQAPLGTVVAEGQKHGLVAAFISHYYGQGVTAQDAGQPLHTVTTLARHGLVTVEIDGETYVITDIGMRMLEPRELAHAMGFPDWYDWSGFTKRDQVKMIGNAVPPPVARALVDAVLRPRPELMGLMEVA
ncbi:MAG TPA: DNA cytosine methyltransferase, partial [Geothrix sp.]|nr:DNA cytosine methyltransferase [Geothrix sp.]